MYDIFLVGDKNDTFIKLKQNFILAKQVDTFQAAQKSSLTDFFWVVWDDVDVLDDFDFEYEPDAWSLEYVHSFLNDELYNGVCLVPKTAIVTEEEISSRVFKIKKEIPMVASMPKIYDIFEIDSYEDYEDALEKSKTDMFWMTSKNIKVDKQLLSQQQSFERDVNHAFKHSVDEDDFYNGVYLLSKQSLLTKKEIEYRHIINRKEWDIVASTKKEYDVFVVDSYEEYLNALENSTTEMFWVTSSNLTANVPDIYFTHDNHYDRHTNHAFIHRVNEEDYYNGVFLCSKHKPLSKREIEYRHIVSAKQWDIVASGPIDYDLFFIDTYEEYLNALENSKTEMFWGQSRNISQTIPNLYFTHDNEYDRYINHAFIHEETGKQTYNGLYLFSKHEPVTEREIDHRHVVSRKEWDIVASGPKKYDIIIFNSYEEYLEHVNSDQGTELFWNWTNNVELNSNFNLDLHFNHENEYDRKQNHNFIHKVNDEEYRNGVFLLSKHSPISKKEFDNRFIVSAKEWDIVASGPVQYPVHNIDSYDEYLTALEETSTEMFWMSSKNITPKIPNLYFTHNNEYDRYSNHSFLHTDNKRNGLFLCSKHTRLSQKEVEHRFIVNAKEWDIVGSEKVDYDVFTIDTYDEYLHAIENTKTEMFWGVSRNIDFTLPEIYFTHDNEYDRYMNHAFVHRVDDTDLYNGVFLFSTHEPVTEREIEHRHIVSKKEWDVIASSPKKYDIFTIDSYDEYLTALEETSTEMFWMTSKNICANIPNIYFTHEDTYNRKENHAFIHDVDGRKLYNGLFLCSKHSPLTEREIEFRHFVQRKEWDIIGSTAVEYPVYEIDNYEEYKKCFEECKTEMFWMSSKNIQANIPNLYFTHDNEYDRKSNHAFVHRVQEKDLYNGLFLCSKHSPLTQKEVEHRFIVERKEWDIVGSIPRPYDVFTVDTYDEYLHAIENTKTEMFWAISANINTTIPDLYFTHDNEYDRYMNHAFVHRVDNIDLYNGVFLFSKHEPVTEREIEHRHIVTRKEWDIVASGPRTYDIFYIETYDDYKHALENSTTEMFWANSRNIKIAEDFSFDLYFSHDNEYDRKQNHVFLHVVDGIVHYNGLMLLSKHAELTPKEVDHRHLVNRKEWNIIASGPVQYDVFTIDSYEDYEYAFENSKTELFWATSANLDVEDDFKFDIYFTHNNEYDRKQNHAFIHRVNGKDLYNGIFLFTKTRKLNYREIEKRFIVDKKEWDIVASGPCKYDTFVIESFEDYVKAMDNSTTELFWGTTPNIDTTDFNFDIYFDHSNEYDRFSNHAFIHRVDNKDLYNGVFLFSKHEPVTEREITHKHIVSMKPWDIVASGPVKYEIFVIDTYTEYLTALKNSQTEMFWGISRNLKVDPNFKFDIYFPHNDEYDRYINHAFIHRVEDEDLYNGVFLFSKQSPITERELEHRFPVNKKEWDIVASGPVTYDKFTVDTYEEYLWALEKSTTELFWAIPRDVKVLDNTLDTYFPHNEDYNRTTNHAYLNGIYHDGIWLCSKHCELSKNEIENRYSANKREIRMRMSTPNPYDVVFISYQEPNADENYSRLLKKAPNAKRVHGVKGIHQAHIEAAKLCTTDMIWIVDGDAIIVDDFDFDYQVPRWDRDMVHVWRSKNPINELIYGYGGVKLFPRKLTLNMDTSKTDMTTSISRKFYPVQEVSNITKFNTGDFETWKSAFRECVKLSSNSIDRQKDQETFKRLTVWTTEGANMPYGQFAIDGAKMGMEFGIKNKGNISKLKLINDFEWLKEQFNEHYKSS